MQATDIITKLKTQRSFAGLGVSLSVCVCLHVCTYVCVYIQLYIYIHIYIYRKRDREIETETERESERKRDLFSCMFLCSFAWCVLFRGFGVHNCVWQSVFGFGACISLGAFTVENRLGIHEKGFS